MPRYRSSDTVLTSSYCGKYVCGTIILLIVTKCGAQWHEVLSSSSVLPSCMLEWALFIHAFIHISRQGHLATPLLHPPKC